MFVDLDVSISFMCYFRFRFFLKTTKIYIWEFVFICAKSQLPHTHMYACMQSRFPPNAHHLNFFGRSAFDKQIELIGKFFDEKENKSEQSENKNKKNKNRRNVPSSGDHRKNNDSLLVIDSHELFQNTQHVLHQMIQFLGLDYYEFSPEQLATKLQGPLRMRKNTISSTAVGTSQEQAATIPSSSSSSSSPSRLSEGGDVQSTALQNDKHIFHYAPQKPETDHSTTSHRSKQLYFSIYSSLSQIDYS
jgi:hypothetical protein